jgi:hypothetical protein
MEGLSSITPPVLQLSSLSNPFTEQELHKIISTLAKGKACRPDGFPLDFFQRFWGIIKYDLTDVLYDFYNNKIDLWRINKAHITLLLKKPGATLIKDFCLISVIAAIPKIITKLLA